MEYNLSQFIFFLRKYYKVMLISDSILIIKATFNYIPNRFDLDAIDYKLLVTCKLKLYFVLECKI